MEYVLQFTKMDEFVRFLVCMRLSFCLKQLYVCTGLDILQNKWSPIYDVIAILQSIQSMLSDPNTGSPADSEAAKLYDKNRKEYDRRVKQIVEKSWLSLDDYIDEQDIADEEDDAETSDSEYCT